ncbi:2-hydroxymuconate tautomerase family protein [Paenibacillus sp. GP183]|uniref:tautomerase family protein n=1 Tax=Paenibacillus sp. GP183 TaxID=1882751 RepID=UPI000899E78B|nr:2-hydroxymuconate tautomerase family protein [Paenibacillus sp. GP183]SEC76675.1 4-oxalocrotonate tautomerase [Paenibacillus sp. GP183]
MPIINVKIAKGRTVEQKQQFVEAITQTAAQILNVKEEWVTVVFDEYERENWATGGTLHSIKFGEGFGKMGVE